MTQTCERSPSAKGDLSETSSIDLGDSSETTKSKPPAQAEKEVQRHLLEIKRESLWNIGSLADAHIRLMLGSLEIADDEAVFHHGKCFVERARAVAKLVNDLRETRGGA
jgi:hypothetical protein